MSVGHEYVLFGEMATCSAANFLIELLGEKGFGIKLYEFLIYFGG